MHISIIFSGGTFTRRKFYMEKDQNNNGYEFFYLRMALVGKNSIDKVIKSFIFQLICIILYTRHKKNHKLFYSRKFLCIKLLSLKQQKNKDKYEKSKRSKPLKKFRVESKK